VNTGTAEIIRKAKVLSDPFNSPPHPILFFFPGCWFTKKSSFKELNRKDQKDHQFFLAVYIIISKGSSLIPSPPQPTILELYVLFPGSWFTKKYQQKRD
jgi:hypothetical protein